MGIFPNRDPRAKLEAQLQAKRAQLDGNTTRLQAAEKRVTECRRKVEECALADDSKGLDVALANKRAAEDLVGALSGAATKLAKEVDDVERDLAAAVDKIMREETSEAIRNIAERLDASASAFGAALADLESILREAELVGVLEAHDFVSDAMAMGMFARDTTRVIEGLRLHRQAVLSGGAPPSLPRAAPEPAPLKLVPSEPTVTLIATKRLKYTDSSGAVIVCGAFNRHDFPEALGRLAIKTNVAVELGDKRAMDFQAAGFATIGTPDEASCEWLGAKGRESPERFGKSGGPPIHSSLTKFEFEAHPDYINRQPQIVTVKTAPIEAMGARNADEEGQS
jgi:hypothetical protein